MNKGTRELQDIILTFPHGVTKHEIIILLSRLTITVPTVQGNAIPQNFHDETVL